MKKRNLIALLSSIVTVTSLSSCSPWLIYQGDNSSEKEVTELNYVNEYGLSVTQRFEASYEDFEGTKNALFFALYNYYGYEGQHFTNKWLGMLDALNEHGISVSGYKEEKDARKFVITREADCDLPEDAVIYMVNNQNWDSGIQFTKPFAKYQPMAVISTCNGVEFADSPILSSGYSISNATMGGFSTEYRNSMLTGSLGYLCAKYTAHILPIYAACVAACDNGSALKNADGSALRLEIDQWAIQTIDEYDEMQAVDQISSEKTTLRKINVDKFFDNTTYATAGEAATALGEWTLSSSQKENTKAIYEENLTKKDEDEAAKRTGEKLKCGIIAPSSVNNQVQLYIDYMKGYLADIYNVEVLPIGSVTSTDSQSSVATKLCNQGADFIISVQDDTDRNSAAQICNEKGVYFGIAGSCQNPIDYEVIKDLPYYVGSVGTSPEGERRAAKKMTEYYLQCMIHRAAGDLKEWQIEYKNMQTLAAEYQAVLDDEAAKEAAAE